jgi:hypothetical protein
VYHRQTFDEIFGHQAGLLITSSERAQASIALG